MKHAKLFLILIMLIVLGGCGVRPYEMGISQSDWNNFSRAEKSQALANYKYIQLQNKNRKLISGNSMLEVGVKNGTADMLPFATDCKYMPVNLTLKEGVCSRVRLREQNSRLFVDLVLCYSNKVLFLDPSRYQLAKASGSLKLYFNPLWRRGFTYKNLTTSGYAKLHNVDITVKLKNVTAQKHK